MAAQINGNNNFHEQPNTGFQHLMQHPITSLELGDHVPVALSNEETRPLQVEDYYFELLSTNNEMQQPNTGFQHLMQHPITSLELGDHVPVALSIEETRPQQVEDYYFELLSTNNEMAVDQL